MDFSSINGDSHLLACSQLLHYRVRPRFAHGTPKAKKGNCHKTSEYRVDMIFRMATISTMPRTIKEGFRDFLQYLTPSSTESQAAKSHRASIESRLKEDFELLRFFRIGSFGNGTSISGYSDVDYLASIPTKKLSSDSGYTLGKLRDSLADRFPSTGVRVDCPAVKVPFGIVRSETTEVVPGDLVSVSGKFIYDIPNCEGGWMRASPDTHNDYVDLVNSKHEGKVKPLIRYIKAWKYFQNVPISSFYLEMWVAQYALTESTILYSIDVKRVLCGLRDSALKRLPDPTGVSGIISPCKTQATYLDAISKLATAARRAEEALNAEFKENTEDAFGRWRLLYGKGFPTYFI